MGRIMRGQLVRMTDRSSLKRREWSVIGLVAVAALLGGCRATGRTERVSVFAGTYGPMTIAVAPAVNLSGSSDFDPARFADLMASELGHAAGIRVIPVSRVLGVFAAQGVDSVQSVTHALELVTLLGADAILVFSVNEYDPFEPPSIGITAQLFGVEPRSGGGQLDPIEFTRQTTLGAKRGGPRSRGLLAETQRVFDASHDSVVAEIREFASLRDADASPYGWRKYVVSQQAFIRFCCHATISELLQGQRNLPASDTKQSEQKVGSHGDSAALAGEG